jgi:hypothetical protein
MGKILPEYGGGYFYSFYNYGGVCNMKKWGSSYKWFALVIVIGFILASCGSSNQASSDVNGVWKNEDGGTVVTINFNGESKTIEMDGKVMPVVIESDTYKEMIVKVQEDVDKISTWIFKKVWTDNGSSFTFILSLPDGTRKNLSMETHS